MAIKTYVLLDHMDATAPIYQTVKGGQRIRITKIPRHRPSLQITFTNPEGKNRTIRYKGNSKTIFQDEQIKDGILANEPFTTTERRDLEFKMGQLTIAKAGAQEYLEAHPEFEGFDGLCDDVLRPVYKLLNKEAETKITNQELRKRAKAATKILDLDLKAAQRMLLRINGSYFKVPDDVDECQNMLIDFLENTEEAGLDAILKQDSELNIDEQTTILIGELINQGTLSFDQVEGKISKKTKAGKWVVIRDMAEEYTMDERKRLFSDFLNSDEGKNLKTDLQGDLKQQGDPKQTPIKKS